MADVLTLMLVTNTLCTAPCGHLLCPGVLLQHQVGVIFAVIVVLTAALLWRNYFWQCILWHSWSSVR